MERKASRAGTGLFLACIFFCSLTGAASAGAETPAEENPQPAQDAPTQKPPTVEVGVEARWRSEFRDNGDFKPADDFDHFVGQRVRVHLLLRAHPTLTFYVEGQDVWLFGAENDKVIHNLAINLYQAYLDWTLQEKGRWTLRAGRQELIYGKERLVGAFNWDNAGRSFDAARLRYTREVWSSDFLWGRLVEVRRGGAPHRVGNRDLYGVYVTRAPQDKSKRTEFYGFYFHDGLRTGGELARPSDTVDIFTFGFRRERRPATGFRYEIENAWQVGDRGPDKQRAAALIASSGFGWGGRWKPSLAFEYDFATGDKNPTDGHSNEFENLFPTNHLHYGYADLVGLRNLHDFRATATIQLHPKLVLQGDYHRLLLARRRGAWKNAGGRVLGFDPTGASGRDLGQEIDLTARVPISKHLNLLGGYSVFLPGHFAIRTRGPETHHFAYIQTTVRY